MNFSSFPFFFVHKIWTSSKDYKKRVNQIVCLDIDVALTEQCVCPN